MVGRNDSCPCGSGKKYKKCCERVVAIQQAEQVRDERELKVQVRLLRDLDRWFQTYFTREKEQEWSRCYRKILHLSEDKPLPKSQLHSFRFWLLFDAPCIEGKRPVQVWRERVISKPETEQTLDRFCGIHLCGYEVIGNEGKYVVLQGLTDQKQYKVQMVESANHGMVVFARLSLLVNRHELFGPYTSFADEMRGEIQMHLKREASNNGEWKRDFWQQNGLQVLGRLMQRSQEIQRMDKWMATSKVMDDSLPAASLEASAAESVAETATTLKEETKAKAEPLQVVKLPVTPSPSIYEPGISEMVENQLHQFAERFVNQHQFRTQQLYHESLKRFREYISSHFGKSFTWSMLTEEVLYHYLGLWYMDRMKTNPVKARIFMNTMKKMFKWLQNEGFADIYEHYVPVYKALFQQIPVALEVKSWMQEHGVLSQQDSQVSGIYKLALSATGATLDLGDRWSQVPLNLRGFPTGWRGNWFWVRGSVVVTEEESYFTDIQGVYPFFDWTQAAIETV
ncbi:hypothetical protein GXN76_10345 [Kroppenstedtia pulmonis]|uniref:SEC-C domain-containing protein n=1 Tax=Kroppenstedtia pulmonis TaxID=1380685 RepID=A0A7D4BKE2_9BACL|nr:SEC-C metal-binding domain-containing protein [Kroppenstedtia pulmonis]QKG84830.1 hypothetical protein GXN76_10345 [Kroppenstedtia pulmonis]